MLLEKSLTNKPIKSRLVLSLKKFEASIDVDTVTEWHFLIDL